MLGVFAEFETNLRRERQLEGIAQAKARGIYTGRKPSIDRAKVLELHATGLGPTEIADKLQIGRASVYRIIGKDTVDLEQCDTDPLSDLAEPRFNQKLHVAQQKALDPNYDVLNDPLAESDPVDALIEAALEAEQQRKAGKATKLEKPIE